MQNGRQSQSLNLLLSESVAILDALSLDCGRRKGGDHSLAWLHRLESTNCMDTTSVRDDGAIEASKQALPAIAFSCHVPPTLLVSSHRIVDG
jgi:hypothetical protein